jgi:hypothetical protein
LRPPSFKRAGAVGDHWAVYLALQHERYWTEAGRTYMLGENENVRSASARARQVVEHMAENLSPGSNVEATAAIARNLLGEFHAAAASYGFGQGIGLNQWEAPFFNADDACEVGAARLDSEDFRAGMTLALRAALETEGKLVLYGNSYEVTVHGPKCLL